MNTPLTRRTFVQHLGAAGAALAAAPIVAAAAGAAEPAGKTILAVVGCAHSHTPGYIQMLKAHKDVRVKYVWDTDAQRAKKWADELGATAVPDDAAVWADPQVKAAVVCSQTNLHQRLVLAGAKAGKHLFVEKPMGVSAVECRRMAEAIEQAGLLFTTGYGMRTTPEHLFLKQQITRGTLGKITRIRGSACHSGSLGHWFDGEWRWMADPKIAGCGGFGDLGTHSLDILMWLIGDVEAVTADIKVVTGRYGPCDEMRRGPDPIQERRHGHAGGRLGRRRQSADAGDFRHRGPRCDLRRASSTSRPARLPGPTVKSPGRSCRRRCRRRWRCLSQPWPASPISVWSRPARRLHGSA